VPSREWSEAALRASNPSGQDTSRPSLLGLSLRLCNPSSALESVWHILEVLEGSPAEVRLRLSETLQTFLARTIGADRRRWQVSIISPRHEVPWARTDERGLVPFGDWICGWAGGPLHSESDFYDLVEAVRRTHERGTQADILGAAHRQTFAPICLLGRSRVSQDVPRSCLMSVSHQGVWSL
jgi:hypothetical protein